MCMLFADWSDINNAIFGAYLSLRGKKLCCCALYEFFDWHLLAQPCTTPTCFFAAIDGVFGKARLGLGERSGTERLVVMNENRANKHIVRVKEQDTFFQEKNFK